MKGFQTISENLSKEFNRHKSRLLKAAEQKRIKYGEFGKA